MPVSPYLTRLALFCSLPEKQRRCPPRGFATSLSRRAGRRVDQDPRISRKREWDTSQVLHPYSRGNGNRRHLDDVHRPLADDMAAQYLGRLAVGDQFAETNLVPVNDCARRRVEAYHRGDDILRPTSV